MTKICKKWVAATGGMRLILAFLYTFVSLSISLNHTYHLAGDRTLHCHQECTNHHDRSSIVGTRQVLDINGENSNSKRYSNNTFCSVCLYSLFLKSSKLSPKVSLVVLKSPNRVQILPQLNFTERVEYLSCISLRAPPKSTS